MSDANKVEAKNPLVYLDLQVGEEEIGRVVIELFKNIVPRTVENFRCLCTGEKGLGTLGKPLHYKGTVFHRLVPDFLIQGGDITNFNGSGGESIYGVTFEDENFELSHEHEGAIGMSNSGPNTNSSQFYITTSSCTHLDDNNVVFGKVLYGLGVVKEALETPVQDTKPLENIIIHDCGQLSDENWFPKDGDDMFPTFPEDWNEAETYQEIINVISNIKCTGNKHFKDKKFIKAGTKYKKALRYINWDLNKRQSLKNEEIKDLRINCLLNSAASHLNSEYYKKTLTLCNEVLKIDPTNVKALFRRAKANKLLKNYEAALQDLKSSSLLEPNNNIILLEIKNVKKLINEYSIIEKERCLKMLKA